MLAIFAGPNGIRAGWSILIFAAFIAAATGALQLVLYLIHFKKPQGALSAGFLILAELISIATVLGANAVMARIENRSIWSYGLTGPNRVTNFLLGCAGGFVSLCLVIPLLWSGGYIVFDGVAMHGVPALTYGAVSLFGFFLVGLAEETIFRGYLLSTLGRGIGFWPAAWLLSFLFAAAHIHNLGENAAGIAQVVLGGLVFCLLLRVTGSLWLSIGFHTTWDWGQSFFYGTPDSALLMQGQLLTTHPAGNPRFSGGAVGPEGSVLAPIGLIIIPLLLVWICRRMGLTTKTATPLL
jgi:membrane protease YdiL (CAAX protease family)